MKTYLVCIDYYYVRDAQVFQTENYSKEELSKINVHSEHNKNDWRDATITPYVDIVQAHSEKEACAQAAEILGYDIKCLYATDISNRFNPDVIHTRVKGGYIYASVNPDPNYPGIDVEYVADYEKSEGLTRPRVLVEYPIDGSLRALIWNDPNNEDYTEEINLLQEQKRISKKNIYYGGKK